MEPNYINTLTLQKKKKIKVMQHTYWFHFQEFQWMGCPLYVSIRKGVRSETRKENESMS